MPTLRQQASTLRQQASTLRQQVSTLRQQASTLRQLASTRPRALKQTFMMPAMILSWIFGLILITVVGFDVILTFWLKLKLILITLLTIYHFYLGKLLNDFKLDHVCVCVRVPFVSTARQKNRGAVRYGTIRARARVYYMLVLWSSTVRGPSWFEKKIRMAMSNVTPSNDSLF